MEFETLRTMLKSADWSIKGVLISRTEARCRSPIFFGIGRYSLASRMD